MNNKKTIIISIASIVILLLSILGYFLYGSMKKETPKVLVPDNQLFINNEPVQQVSFDYLFNINNTDNPTDNKSGLSRENFMILLARTVTKDNVKQQLSGLSTDLFPVVLKDDPNKEYLAYFMLNKVGDQTLTDYSFKTDSNDFKKPITVNEVISLFYYSIEKEKDKLKLTEVNSQSIVNKSNITFDKELSGLEKYKEFIDNFTNKDINGNEGVSLERIQPFLKSLFDKSSTEVFQDKTLNPNALYKKENDYMASDPNTPSNDPNKHSHGFSQDPYYEDKHILLHAIVNYQTKYGKIPVTNAPVPKIDDKLSNMFIEYKYDVKTFKVLDVDALYPEFLKDKFKKTIVIVEPDKKVMFFVTPYTLQDGQVLY